MPGLPTFAPDQQTFYPAKKKAPLPSVLPEYEPSPALSYRQVLEHYDRDRAVDPRVSQLTLPEYSAQMNQETGSQMFDEGSQTGFGALLKKWNVGVNQLIESSGLPNALHRIGSSVTADLFAPTTDEDVAQAQRAGELVGGSLEGFPRAVVNMAPMLVGGALAPETGGASLLPLLGIGATSALTGADTYEQTGSKGLGLLSAGTAGLMPALAGKTGQWALGAAGATLKNEAGQLVGETLTQRLAQVAGSQGGAAALMEISHQAGSVATTGGFETSPEHFLSSIVGQVPFLAFDLPTLMNGGQIASALQAKNKTAEANRSVLEAQNAAQQSAADRVLARENFEQAYSQGQFAGKLPDYTASPMPLETQSTLFSPKYEDTGYGVEQANLWPNDTSKDEMNSRRREAFEARQTLQAANQIFPATSTPEPFKPQTLSELFGSTTSSFEPKPIIAKEGELSPTTKTESLATLFGAPVRAFEPTVTPKKVTVNNRGEVMSSGEVKAVTNPVQEAAAFDASKVTPSPIPTATMEGMVKPVLAEPDMVKAISGIKDIYEKVLKPEHGVRNIILDNVNDANLRKSISNYVEEGKSLDDAVRMTTQGVRNALAKSVQKQQALIIDDNVQALFASIKAKIQGKTLAGIPDPSILADVAQVGYHIAKNLLKYGKFKLSDWKDQLIQGLGMDPGFTPEQWNAILRHVKRDIGAEESQAEEGVVATRRRERLGQSMEGLNSLDEGFNRLPAEAKGNQKSPLTKFSQWRDQILESNQNYAKYPQVDEGLLKAAGNFKHNGQTWLTPEGKPMEDRQALSYLRKAAQFAYKAATKSEQGGQEIVPGQFKDLNEANIEADSRNSTLPQDSDHFFEGGIIKRGKPEEQVVLYKTYKRQKSLDENFKPERDSTGDEVDQVIEDPDAVVTGSEEDPRGERGRSLDDALGHVNDEGEVIDPMEDAATIAGRVKANSDEGSSTVSHQQMSDVFDNVMTRLMPDDPIVNSVSNRDTVSKVARTRLFVEYARDSRQTLSGDGFNWSKFVDFANSKLHPDFQFTADDPVKQATNWWTNTGKEFWKDWSRRQPELIALHDQAKTAKPSKVEEPVLTPKYDPTLPQNVRDQRRAAAAQQGGIVTLPELNVPKVFFAKSSSVDFARSFFERRGDGPEQAQRSSDAVLKLARAVAFFKGGEKASVMLRELPGNVLGVAIDSLAGKWAPLVALNSKITSDGFLTMVAGHESFEVLKHAQNRGELDSTNVRAMQAMQDRANSLNKAERMSILTQAVAQLPEGLKSEVAGSQELAGFLNYSARDPNEFVATLAGIHVLGATESKSGFAALRDTLLYGDGYISRMLSAVFDTAQTLFKALKGLGASAEEGLISDITPGQEMALTSKKANIEHFNKLFEAVRNSNKEVQAAVGTLTSLDALSPENFWNAVKNGFRPDVERTGDKDIDSSMAMSYARTLPEGDPAELNRFEAWWSDFVQLTESHPVLKPILGEMLDYTAKATDSARNALSTFFTRDFVRGSTVVGEPLKALKRVGGSDKVGKAFSERVLAEGQLTRPLDQNELSQLYTKHGLTSEERADVQAVRDALSDSNRIVGQQIIRSSRDSIMHGVARILMAGNDTPYKNALKAADLLTNIATAQIGQSVLPAGLDPTMLIQGLTQEMGFSLDKLVVAGQAASDMMPGFQALTAAIKKNESTFFTEQRFGKYSVSYTVEGEKLPGRISGESKKEVRQKLEEYQKTHKLTSDPIWYDNSEGNFSGIKPDVVAAFKQIGDAAYQRTAATLGQEAADGARAAFSGFDRAIEKELSARGVKKYTQSRTHAPGRETLDMLENSLKYLTTVPWALEKNWLRDRASVAMLDPQMVSNPSAAKVARQQVENVLAPESPWARKAKEWTFNYFLGGNLSSIAIEQAQPMLAVPAQLQLDGSGVGKSFGYLTKAYKLIGEGYLKDKISDPFVSDMVKRLDDAGVLERQTLSNFFDEDASGINLSQLVSGNMKLSSVKDLAKYATSHIGSVMRNLYSRGTGASSRVTAAAASLHAQDLIASGKLAPEEAFNYVRRVLSLTAPGTAGKVGRPVGPYSSADTRSAVGVLASLQGYSVTMWSMMGRLAKQAVQSGSMTSTESKAFMTMAGTQLLAAGALGFPLAGTAIAVLNSAFPEWNLKAGIKKNMASMFGEDQANGGLFSDVMLRGLPSTLTGVDLSTRLSLSNMLGVSDYDGFQMSHLFGAPGAVLTNMWNGVHSAAQGNFSEAIEKSAPTSLKNVLRVYNDGGAVRDQSGRLQYEPNPAEQLALLTGFTPKKVAQMKEFSMLARQQDDTAKSESQSFYTRTAQMLGNGEFAAVRQALVERERMNPGEFSAAEGLKVVVQLMQDQTMPEDPRRGGSKMGMTDRADLLNTYGPSAVGPSEKQRLAQASQIQRQFGLVGGADQGDLMRAGLVDLYMQKNPTMTRAQARLLVDQRLRKSPLPTLR